VGWVWIGGGSEGGVNAWVYAIYIRLRICIRCNILQYTRIGTSFAGGFVYFVFCL